MKLIKIENKQTLNNALLELVKNDFDMARVVKCVEKVNLRSREDGFQALLRAIVGQQLSVKAAAAFRKAQAQERISEAQKVMDNTAGRVREAQVKLGEREAVRAGLVEEGIKVPPTLNRSIATMKKNLETPNQFSG